MTTATHTMLYELVTTLGYTTAFIASKIGVSKKTMDRFWTHGTTSIKTETNIINFYCAYALSKKPNDKNFVN